MEIFKIIFPPTRLAILSFFYPLPGMMIQQNWSVSIQALKINEATKFETLKKPIFSLFDVIFFLFNGIIINKIFR